MIYREIVVPSWDVEGAAYHLDALANLAVAQNEMDQAARLFGMAETVLPVIRFEMSAAERTEHDRAVVAARAALGDEAYRAEYEEGNKMTLDQAVAYALGKD